MYGGRVSKSNGGGDERFFSESNPIGIYGRLANRNTWEGIPCIHDFYLRMARGSTITVPRSIIDYYT
jgi:hypothetical protein